MDSAGVQMRKNGSKNNKDVIQIRSVVIFLVTTLTTALVIEFLTAGSTTWNATSLFCKTSKLNSTLNIDAARTFAIYGKSRTTEHLIHIKNVLERMGYIQTSLDDEWNLLWAHDYPFLQMPEKMKKLKDDQVVNHFPGIGFITNKVDLSTLRLPFLPRAFRLPSDVNEFLDYAQRTPKALFVEKHNEHRFISIRSLAEINLNSSETFVQEYVKNPLLVDGYKFDIGVYVAITSVNPLRIYVYTGDVLFRYCPLKYYPFDARNIDKYVVGDDYLPTWEVPSLKKYYKLSGGSMRDSFDAYLRSQQLDPSQIWTQTENIIRQTILAKEQDIVRILKSYKTKNFFELMRFDLIVDEKLRVHLMEANMSPNLSSAHFKPNSLLYEQILYSVLNLVAVGSPIRSSDLRNEAIDEMITAEKNIATYLNDCAEFECHKSCLSSACDLCIPCMTGTEVKILENAHREHLHRIAMKRIFPKPIINLDHFNLVVEIQNMTKRNNWMTRWFYAKCQFDNSWCY